MDVIARLIEGLRSLTEPKQEQGQTCNDDLPKVAKRKAYKSLEDLKK